MENKCLITIDVEEWFQVENLRCEFPKDSWNNQNSTVVKNTTKILDILDSYDIKATFFILGLVTEKNPDLIKLIFDKGHEISSHGSGHDLTYNLDDGQLIDDINNSKIQLEKITGKKIYGYRAPNFSVSNRLIDTLEKLNFKYDSSYNPFQLNQRYGKIEFENSTEYNGVYKLNDNFYEIPLSSLKIFNHDFPMAGGAYFRIFPFKMFKKMVKTKLRKDSMYHFYLHPWELEPDQPRIKNIKLNYKFRHYTGLSKTEDKFEKLIIYLKKMDCQFYTISEYLNKMNLEQQI